MARITSLALCRSPLSSCSTSMPARCLSSAQTPPCSPSSSMICAPKCSGAGIDALNNLFYLFLQHGGGEGFDHIAIHTGLGGFNDLVPLGLGGDHEHRQIPQPLVVAHLSQQLDAAHARHVPVGDEKIEVAAAQHGQAGQPVIGLGGMIE